MKQLCRACCHVPIFFALAISCQSGRAQCNDYQSFYAKLDTMTLQLNIVTTNENGSIPGDFSIVGKSQYKNISHRYENGKHTYTVRGPRHRIVAIISGTLSDRCDTLFATFNDMHGHIRPTTFLYSADTFNPLKPPTIFAARVKAAVISNDTAFLASVTNYPLEVLMYQRKIVIHNRMEFYKFYNRIFIDSLRASIETADTEDLGRHDVFWAFGRGSSSIWITTITKLGEDRDVIWSIRVQ